MTTNPILEKKQRITAQILQRHNYELSTHESGYCITSPKVTFSDFSAPLFYSLICLVLGLSLFTIAGPLEGIIFSSVGLLGLVYTGLLYQQKVNLSKRAVEIIPQGVRLTDHKEGEQFISQTAIQQLLIVLDPEDKIKAGALTLVSEQLGSMELIKLTGDNQKYIKDDLEKIIDFIVAVFDQKQIAR